MKNTEKILPTYEMIELSKIEVADYQRITNSRIVKDIVKNFKSQKLGVLTISLRDGKYYIVDGLHRLTALKMMNHSFAMCEVHRKMKYEEEAELFYSQGDNRRKLATGDVFFAKLEAKDETAMRIESVITSQGFSVLRKGGKSSYKIAAISTVCEIERLYGLRNLNKTLSLIRNTWNGSPSSTDSKILMGVSLFVKNHEDEIKESVFVKRLGKHEPTVIIREGSSDISNKEYKRFEAVIAKYYNKNTSKNRLTD